MSLVIDWQRFILAPPRRIMAGADWQGRGPDYTLRTLAKGFEARGGTIYRGTEAVALMERDGACVGVETRDPLTAMQLSADAVVLADGGFQGNLDLVRQTISACARETEATRCGDGRRRRVANGEGHGRLGGGPFLSSMATCCRVTRSRTTRRGHIRSSTNSASPESWSMAAAGDSPTRAAVGWHWQTHRQASRPDGDLGHL
jgi:glycine/D-amino acid oxidase-like deaminating enzyme